MNAALDPAVSRFAALREESDEEAELWRGKLQACRNLYGFLSQVIPYQDSDLERLYTYLRHLSAKLPRRRSGPAYHFDDDVRLEYYRLQKINEGSIALQDGDPQHLDGKVTLKPINPEFEPIVLADVDEDAVQVVAELVEVVE